MERLGFWMDIWNKELVVYFFLELKYSMFMNLV